MAQLYAPTHRLLWKSIDRQIHRDVSQTDSPGLRGENRTGIVMQEKLCSFSDLSYVVTQTGSDFIFHSIGRSVPTVEPRPEKVLETWP